MMVVLVVMMVEVAVKHDGRGSGDDSCGGGEA